jgi:hypothetical protein
MQAAIKMSEKIAAKLAKIAKKIMKTGKPKT